MELETALATLLNTYSQETASNTPDFILAQYLLWCLGVWNQAVQQRETRYGRDARLAVVSLDLPGPPTVPIPSAE